MKRLVLMFQTDQGKVMRMTLPYPKDGLDAQTVSAAMNDIIASGVIRGTTGSPTAVVSAYVEDITRTDII